VEKLFITLAKDEVVKGSKECNCVIIINKIKAILSLEDYNHNIVKRLLLPKVNGWKMIFRKLLLEVK